MNSMHRKHFSNYTRHIASKLRKTRQTEKRNAFCTGNKNKDNMDMKNKKFIRVKSVIEHCPGRQCSGLETQHCKINK
jgi:hypothetical protein